MFKNFGGGASTGSVSMTRLMRTMEMTRRNSSTALRRYQRRFPRFDPRAMTTVNSDRELFVADIDVVRQLVMPPFDGREIGFQVLAHGEDGLDDAFGEFVFLEADGQARGDVIPETGRHFFVDAAIAEDDEAMLLADDEEQHAIALGGLRHADSLERPFRPVPDVFPGTRLDVNADLAGGLALRL